MKPVVMKALFGKDMPEVFGSVLTLLNQDPPDFDGYLKLLAGFDGSIENISLMVCAGYAADQTRTLEQLIKLFDLPITRRDYGATPGPIRLANNLGYGILLGVFDAITPPGTLTPPPMVADVIVKAIHSSGSLMRLASDCPGYKEYEGKLSEAIRKFVCPLAHHKQPFDERLEFLTGVVCEADKHEPGVRLAYFLLEQLTHHIFKSLIGPKRSRAIRLLCEWEVAHRAEQLRKRTQAT